MLEPNVLLLPSISWVVPTGYVSDSENDVVLSDDAPSVVEVNSGVLSVGKKMNQVK